MHFFFLIKPCVNIGKVINEQARTKFGKKIIAGLNRHTRLTIERMKVIFNLPVLSNS